MSELDPARTFVLDTSAIVDGRAGTHLTGLGLGGLHLVIAEATVTQLEVLASEGRETGRAGLAEVASLRERTEAAGGRLVIEGERPRGRMSELEAGGWIDAEARRLAEGLGATLVTSDRVQEGACAARGIRVLMLGQALPTVEGIALLRYFDSETMSVHLRARTRPRAKRGAPGRMEVVTIADDVLEERDLEAIAREIVETAERSPDGFIETDAGGSTIVQLENLRISIARPPFSDAFEITAVRPVARTTMADYSHADLLMERLSDRQRGVLVAGPPGAGKSTFVQAVADHLETSGWVIKTMEKPRDLVVSDEITQYTALLGDMANTADVLLLVRPDYTIFDEMRRTPDFHVFADMRMAGVGMIGVVHATRGIDGLQRLIGRVELGMIPQIVDTVIFIGDGDVREILELSLTVRAPSGIMDEGLARPIIEVVDHQTGRLAYEIYTFAQQVVVAEVDEAALGRKPAWVLAERALAQDLRRMVHGRVEVELVGEDSVVVQVDEDEMAALIGRGGSIVRELEAEYHLHFDIRPLPRQRRGPDDTKSAGRASRPERRRRR